MLRRLSRPNLILFFDLVGSNYSKVVFLSSLLRHESPTTPPLSPLTVPFSPSWLWYPEFPAKTTVCQRITFLWSRCQSVVFQSWARALTPDLQWLLPWRSQAEITVNAGLWYPLENGSLSPKGNTMMVRRLSMCVCTCMLTHTDRQTRHHMAEVKEKWMQLPDQSGYTRIFKPLWTEIREDLWGADKDF